MAVREEMRGVVDEDLQRRVSNIRTFLDPGEGAARGMALRAALRTWDLRSAGRATQPSM